ncbi:MULTISPECIES: XylR N-terminal domain-containing protein [Paenibacillus]|uniref:XylR N-terminal domain-containing protein n=1 Tax=Paenibacillus TaxID=44249 RepID=UPI00114111DE|nr:XylR N-terminal domain-containing protein [Paenibacillus sp. tmac-D7]
MKAADLKLSQFYKTAFGTEDSQFEKMITIPTSALGTLRKELIETLGPEQTKGFLLRHGWHCGVSDALKMKKLDWDNNEEALYAGPKMHILHGHLEEVIILQNDFDFDEKTIHMEAIWRNSYEAKEHLKLFGKSDHAVCHTLVGYASGYLSTIIGEKVIVIEQGCHAMGDECCYSVCKTVKKWNGEVDDILKYYEPSSLINELNQTFEKLKIERDNLNKSYQVHTRLMNEVLRENDLSSIAGVLSQTAGLPVMIEDTQQKILAVSGISEEEAKQRQIHDLKVVTKTELMKAPAGHNLVTPIFFQRKIAGYCSFLYNVEQPQEVDSMILERAALACSTYMLNEHTRFSAEQRMRGSFLEDVLARQICTEELMRRAHYLGFDLKPPHFMVAIHSETIKKTLNKDLSVIDDVVNSLSIFCKDRQINALTGQKSGIIIMLLSGGDLSKISVFKKEVCRKIADFLSRKYPNDDFKLGVSSTAQLMEDITQLHEESVASLKIMKRNSNIVHFDSLGIEGVLFQAKNADTIEKFVYKKLGNLIREDKNKDMELTKTLFHYLNNGCNVHKTARVMNFSISGLRYRLQRVNEILQSDINRPNVTYQIYLALHSLIALGELDIDVEVEEGSEL